MSKQKSARPLSGVPLGCLVFALTASSVSFTGPAAAQSTDAPQNCATTSPTRRLPMYEGYAFQPDGRIRFKLCAPEADNVDLSLRGDIGAASQALALERDEQGYWTGVTEKPVVPGVHRYTFVVDGLHFTDPMNSNIEQSVNGLRSLLEVAGPETGFYSYDAEIPHGAVSIVNYWSDTLGIARRARIYTPPGYMKDAHDYPVLYLIHGGGGSDDVWTSTGRAHFILDNLIAAGKAKPMIVVMPEAHTPITPDLNIRNNTRFRDDLIEDLIPYVDANYRTIAQPGSRAMAGLSMGSGHTLNFGLPNPDVFRYIGAFSMGIGSSNGREADVARAARYISDNAAGLRQAARDMKLVYFAFGEDDPWYYTVAPTKEMLEDFDIDYMYVETEGAHEWLLWRKYLADFVPRLFR